MSDDAVGCGHESGCGGSENENAFCESARGCANESVCGRCQMK